MKDVDVVAIRPINKAQIVGLGNGWRAPVADEHLVEESLPRSEMQTRRVGQ
jgi:hypothetical protein